MYHDNRYFRPFWLIGAGAHQRLVRVKDMKLKQTMISRMLSLASLILITSDRTSPTCTIDSIRDAVTVKELLRQHWQAERIRHGVREVDTV